MKKAYFLIFTFVFSCLLMAQHVNVTFKVNTLDSNDVYIVGNLPQLGNWNPMRVKLNNLGNQHIITIPIKISENVEFKFTRGSWQTEALDDAGNIPPNNTLIAYNDTTINFDIFKWGNTTNNNTFKGQITGTLRYHPQFEGKGIIPRNIVVWLPPDYEVDTLKRYPVLYMHDGQNLFDPSTSSFGTDWQMDETADSLIRQGKIKPLIIVGIYCTENRTAEYARDDTSKLYMDFVVNELKPFIDKNYRTLPDRENCYTGGSSAGGLISFKLHWEHNDVFSKALCFSPAFKIEWIDYVKVVENSKNKKPINVYIANGGKGIDVRLQPGIDDMIKALEKKQYKLNKDYFVNIYPNDNHSEADWAKQLPYYFILMFGAK
jgi:predicted alpha/beta superfamily hydrolase